VILEGLRRVDEANMVRQTLPDGNAVMTISASQAGRSRDVSLEAGEWNILALVDGHRSLSQICRHSPLDEQTTMSKLAQLKLAGLITQTDRRPQTSSDQLEKMIERLAGLFESYLNEKSSGRSVAASRRISETILENRQ